MRGPCFGGKVRSTGPFQVPFTVLYWNREIVLNLHQFYISAFMFFSPNHLKKKKKRQRALKMKIFVPYSIRPHSYYPHRIILPPMCSFRSDGASGCEGFVFMFTGTDVLLCKPSLFLLPLLMPVIGCTCAVPELFNNAQLRERLVP